MCSSEFPASNRICNTGSVYRSLHEQFEFPFPVTHGNPIEIEINMVQNCFEMAMVIAT